MLQRCAPLALCAAFVTMVSALTMARSAVASQPAVEVHWDALTAGSYRRAGDYTSDFSPGDAGNGTWQLLDTGGAPELGFIKEINTGSGTVEVHLDALSGGSYRRVGDYTSDFSPADAANGVWQLFGSSGGAPELGFIKLRKTPGTVEVHVDALSGGSYRRVGDHTSDFSPADAGNGTWQLVPTGGAPELGFVKLRSTPGTVEVHVDALSGTSYRRVADDTSDFSPADAGSGVWQLFGSSGGAPELGFIKLRNTPGTVEVHVDGLTGTSYRRLGDSVSDFSPADAGNGAWQLFGAPGGAPQLGFVKSFPPAQPATPPVEPVVQTQVLSAPPPTKPGQRLRVRAKFVMGWTWNYSRTRLHTVRAIDVPRHARIEVRCKGPGCPTGAVAAGYKGLRGLLRALEGRVFRAGDVLTITVSAPNRRTERLGVRIRDGKEPKKLVL